MKKIIKIKVANGVILHPKNINMDDVFKYVNSLLERQAVLEKAIQHLKEEREQYDVKFHNLESLNAEKIRALDETYFKIIERLVDKLDRY